MPPSKPVAISAVLDDPARAVLEVALAELGESAEQVSVAIEMPSSYLRTYLDYGVPRAIPNRLRRRLATYLGIPEYALT